MDKGALPTYRRPFSPAGRRRTRWYAWLVGGCVGMCILLVIFCAAIGGAVTGLIYTFSAQKEMSSTGTQELAVVGTPIVNVTNTAGSITVERGTPGAVRIRYTKHAYDVTQGDARRSLRAIPVTISQSGDEIVVRAGSTASAASVDALGSRQTVDLNISVPPTANLDLRLASGNLQVMNVAGTLTASVQAGNADIHEAALNGSDSIRLGAGNLTFDGALGSGCVLDLSVATGNVDVALLPTSSSHIVADTTVGDVSIDGWSATIGHSGTGSTATADTATTPTSLLKVHTDTGNITIRMNG